MEPTDPSRAGMKYENAYVWLIFVSCLDILLTWIVLYRGGREANVLAAMIIRRFGLVGMVLFKLGIVLFVVAVCEAIGRRKPDTGRKFAHAAVAVSALPVVVGLILLTTRML